MSAANGPLEVVAYTPSSRMATRLQARGEINCAAATLQLRPFGSARRGSDQLATMILSLALMAIAVYDSYIFVGGLL
jgi:hypothetical protein